MKRISCPLDGCVWVLEVEEPNVPDGALAEVFGPGVVALTALNRHHQDVEAQLRDHFRGHQLADFLKTITRLNESLQVAHETAEHFGERLAEATRRECTALCRDVEADRDRLLPVVEAVGKWVEVRQNPRMVATDNDDRALMIAYAALGADADVCRTHVPRADELPAASPAGASTADEGDGRG